MWNFPLNPTSYKLYAISNYRDGKSTWNEFFLDMKLMTSVYRLIAAHKEKRTYLNQILNAIIRLGNVFHKESLGRLLLVSSPDEIRSDVKTILFFLSRLPNSIPEYDLNMVQFDADLIEELQKI